MKTNRYVGVFMDHANAQLIEFSIDDLKTETFESAFTNDAKDESITKSEKLMHNKEQ